MSRHLGDARGRRARERASVAVDPCSLEALAADEFREVRAATEAPEPALLVLELRDLRAT
jgi:hypothetical protein